MFYLVLLSLAAADDVGCLLQTKKEPVGLEQEDVPCPEGMADYTFTEAYGWNVGAYDVSSDDAAPGVKITETSVPAAGAGDCVEVDGQGAAVNSDNILIFEAAAGSGIACQTSSGRASITLSFTVPQTISSATVTSRAPQRDSILFLTMENGQTVQHDFAVEEGDQTVTVDPPVMNVVSMRIALGGPIGLKSATFCRFETSIVGGDGPPPGDLLGEEDSASLVGDPHIHTLDGREFTLLQQGTFEAWHLKDIPVSYETGKGTQKALLNWQLLAHYSGHLSFTRGLLLIDKTVLPHKKAEITSKQCRFFTRQGVTWEPVEEKARLSSGGTELKLVQLKSQHKTRRWDLHLNKITGKGSSTVATLRVRCIPGRHINAKIHMARKQDISFVEGQMASKRVKGMSALQVDTADTPEKEPWEALGGSAEAVSYLQQVDEEPAPQLLQTCSQADKEAAAKICEKYLTRKGDYFQDCVFDVCSGGGEEAAELAAEIQSA